MKISVLRFPKRHGAFPDFLQKTTATAYFILRVYRTIRFLSRTIEAKVSFNHIRHYTRFTTRVRSEGLFFQRFSSAPRAKMRRKIEFNAKFLEFSEKSLQILAKKP